MDEANIWVFRFNSRYSNSNQDFNEKSLAYKCDVIYATNNELGFDYLRDNMAHSVEQKVQCSLDFAIVDEVDSILIDEARTPLIISGPSSQSSDLYHKIRKFVPVGQSRVKVFDPSFDIYWDFKKFWEIK